MSLSVGFYILFIATYGFAIGVMCRPTDRQPDDGQIDIAEYYSNRAVEDFDPEKEDVIDANHIKGYTIRERQKRVASLVAKGIAAVLTGTKLLSLGKSHRRFGKTGNSNTALHDFHTLVDKSRGVSEVRAGKTRILSANVGEKQVLLKIPGQRGNPTLDIIDLKGKKYTKPGEAHTSGQYIDRIVYKQTDIE